MSNTRRPSYSVTMLVIGLVGVLMQPVQAAHLNDLIESGEPVRIAGGFRFTEGPLWHPNGYLLFSDILADTIYKWTSGEGIEVFRSPSGYSNGLTFDRQGRLIACEHVNRRVSRTNHDGTIVTLASEYDGLRLNSPNDAITRSDGSIYFTDPPYGLTAEYGIPGVQELPFQGVYRLSTDGKTLTLLTSDMNRPNGLAFSPDEKVLYVADSQDWAVYVFNVQPDGSLANQRKFAATNGWPDGVAVDVRGNLYVTLNRPAVQVFTSSGEDLGLIEMPEETENLRLRRPRQSDVVPHERNVGVPDSNEGSRCAAYARFQW